MTPEQLLTKLKAMQREREMLLHDLSADNADVDAIPDKRDRTFLGPLKLGREEGGRDELLLRGNIAKLDKQIDAKIALLKKSVLGVREASADEVALVDEERVLEKNKALVKNRESILKALNARDVNIDKIAAEYQRTPSRVVLQFDGNTWAGSQEVRLKGKLIVLEDAIEAKIAALRAERIGRCIASIDDNLDDLVQQKEELESKMQRITEERDASGRQAFYLSEIQERSQLRAEIDRLNPQISRSAKDKKAFDSLLQMIHSRESYLSAVNMASPTTLDLYLDKRKPLSENRSFLSGTKRIVENELREQVHQLDAQIDARLRMLNRPMKGGTQAAVSHKREQANKYFESVDNALKAIKSCLQIELGAHEEVLQKALSELEGLESALHTQRDIYLARLIEPAGSLNDVPEDNEFNLFHKRCGQALDAFGPRILSEAKAVIPKGRFAEFKMYFNNMIKSMSEALATVFSRQEDSVVENKDMDVSNQYKAQVQEFIQDKENQAPKNQTKEDDKPEEGPQLQ
ncbi:MAG: hypothetical protein K0U37_07590 [Gammaproteobacteria bacterium]|nr:hypothetical protein [Gammaproteobacteria bacterium]